MKFAPGAWKYAIWPLVVAPFAVLISATASVVSLALGVATLAFFRDPDRTPPVSGTVAPADGNVSVLRTEGDRTRLGIFMNVWHVHVVRSPFDATVVDVEHVDGANRPAFSKDSDRNERVHVTLELEDPAAVVPDQADVVSDPNSQAPTATVTFVAGAFARRIHPYVEAGDRLERGQRIGHIAFGSRVDVLFPTGVSGDDIAVEPGQSTTAGETVILDAPPTADETGLAGATDEP
ncbi:protein sorting system archaetidylserine decarboxylase [Halostagnicola kamekurae]|uniref:Phosphatidylserine decarboxylase n=1 Tax=Halostagnicola kamekurae TaxID=619731 RepID=A0A1I6UE38_9EURY|nr:protein sorting system archaetidylserine decarboxylase [Halostagnicola kamekurae]SFS99648.1 phosphatidylserine decarboxylase [Halostagnicola kamekurae]